MVKSTGCSSSRPRFSLYHLRGSSHVSVSNSDFKGSDTLGQTYVDGTPVNISEIPRSQIPAEASYSSGFGFSFEVETQLLSSEVGEI